MGREREGGYMGLQSLLCNPGRRERAGRQGIMQRVRVRRERRKKNETEGKGRGPREWLGEEGTFPLPDRPILGISLGFGRSALHPSVHPEKSSRKPWEQLALKAVASRFLPPAFPPLRIAGNSKRKKRREHQPHTDCNTNAGFPNTVQPYAATNEKSECGRRGQGG